MPATDMPLIVDLAGRDDELRTALDDLPMGRWFAMRDLLLKTGSDWLLRTSRSQALAIGVGDGQAVAAWLKEEPLNADALMMWARVLTRQATRGMNQNKGLGLLREIGRLARDACWKALRRSPEDPVPWVCLLDLAKLPFDAQPLDPFYRQRAREWDQPPDAIGLFTGPWPLLAEVDRRDPGNREAYHRMLQYAEVRQGGGWAVDFARWVTGRIPAGSHLHVLPLYSFVSTYQRHHGSGQSGAISFWTNGQVRHYACKARDDWFYSVPRPARSRMSLLDLNHLAYVLVASGENGANLVFDEIGPYATSAPWAQISASLNRDWQAEFRRMSDSTRAPRSRRR